MEVISRMDGDYHSYCKKRGDRVPSIFQVSDHNYSIIGKRERSSPNGYTPYAKSKRPTYQNENLIFGVATKSKWNETETTLLLELAAETKLHSKRFWEKYSEELNTKFATRRTGASGRMYFKRIRPGQPSPQSQDTDCVAFVKAKKDTFSQTDISIPVLQREVNRVEDACGTVHLKVNKGKQAYRAVNKCEPTDVLQETGF